MADAPPPPGQVILGMVSGLWVSRAVHAAAVLGLADHVDGAKTVDQLATATQTRPHMLARLLRALASVGVFQEREDGLFEPTPTSDVLRTGTPDSMRSTVMSELGPTHYLPWGELLHSLRTGEIAFNHAYGEPIFEHFRKNPDRARIFNQSMSELTAVVEPAVLEAYDFGSAGTLVDIGGGHGGLLSAVLQKHKTLRGIVFDSPEVVAGAPARFAADGVADRASATAGDFFQSVPEGADLYMMKHIIHDWNDDQCVTILQNCRRAMKPTGKVLIIDQILPGRNEPSLGKWCDLLMMVMAGGSERSAEAFETLLRRAGLKCSRIIPTQSLVGIVEAVPA